MDAKAHKHLSDTRKKLKRRRGDPRDLKVLEDNGAQNGGRFITLLCGDANETETPSPRKAPRRRNPAPKQDKEIAKLDKLFQLAWKETYESRKRKLS